MKLSIYHVIGGWSGWRTMWAWGLKALRIIQASGMIVSRENVIMSTLERIFVMVIGFFTYPPYSNRCSNFPVMYCRMRINPTANRTMIIEAALPNPYL